MEREFIELQNFVKQWKDLGLTENDILELELFLCSNPEAGKIISGTGGVRKLRWRISNTGKSGGIRVLYIDYAFYEKIYFLSVFSKLKKISLSNEERKLIKIRVNQLKEILREKDERI